MKPQPEQRGKLTTWKGAGWSFGPPVHLMPTLYYGCPYGAPGDRLWVKEAFIPDPPINGEWPDMGGDFRLADIPDAYRSPSHVLYKADPRWAHAQDWLWRPVIFMPRWASRITLEVTEVRVEQLQDISEEDAVAEGCTAGGGVTSGPMDPYETDGHTAVEDYAAAWDELNAKRGFPWESNPWVWAVNFKQVEL
jgi:hypothetical protein